MKTIYWLLPAAALCLSACHEDLPDATLAHDGSGTVQLQRSVAVESIFLSDPQGCIAVPPEVGVSATATALLPAQSPEPATIVSLPNIQHADALNDSFALTGLQWHCFDFPSPAQGYAVGDSGTATYTLTNITNENTRVLTLLDAPSQKPAVLDIHPPGHAPRGWHNVPAAAPGLDSTHFALSGDAYMLGDLVLAYSPGYPPLRVAVGEQHSATINIGTTPEDASWFSLSLPVSNGESLAQLVQHKDHDTLALLVTRDGITWEVASSDLALDDVIDVQIAYDTNNENWVAAATQRISQDSLVSHILRFAEQAGGLAFLDASKPFASSFLAIVIGNDGTVALIGPDAPSSLPDTSLWLEDGNGEWEAVYPYASGPFSTGPHRGTRAPGLAVEPDAGTMQFSALELDLSDLRTPPLRHVISGFAFDPGSLHMPRILADGDVLVNVVDNEHLLYSFDAGRHWEAVRITVDELAPPSASALIFVTEKAMLVNGALLLPARLNSSPLLLVVDVKTGAARLGNGAYEGWSFYAADSSALYRIGYDRTVAEAKVQVFSDTAPSPSAARRSKSGGALHWLACSLLMMLAFRFRRS